jgi:hypothetical protein
MFKCGNLAGSHHHAEKTAPISIIIASYYVGNIKDCIKFVQKIQKDFEVKDVVFVNNHAESTLGMIPKDWKYISGTNYFWEWSAWQEGLENLKLEDRRQGVLCFNDTILSHRQFTFAAYLALVKTIKKSQLVSRCSLIGFKDFKHGAPMRFQNHIFNEWISSYVFFINVNMLEKLDGNLISSAHLVEKSLEPASIESFFKGFNDSTLQNYLDSWLFQGGWYRSNSLTEKNIDFFKKKTQSIIFEKLLSSKSKMYGDILCPFKENKWLEIVHKIFNRIGLFRIK